MIEVWIGRAGKRHGPYPRAQILAAHRDGKLHETDLLWWQGLAQWEPMGGAITKLDAMPDAPPADEHASASPAAGELALADEPAAQPVSAAARPASGVGPAVEGVAAVPAPASPVAPAPAPATESYERATAATVVPDRVHPGDRIHADSYAGFWRRFGAVLIDGLIQIVVLGAILSVTGRGSGFLTIIALLAPWIYFAAFESGPWRATPGKHVLGIRVVRVDSGEPLTFLRATGRYFMRFISQIFFIGYVMQIFTQRRQTLHDLVTDSVVIRD